MLATKQKNEAERLSKLNSSYQITSKLNFNIKEAILNEICLRNIKTEEECLQWYKMTFYYITNCDCTLIDIGLKNDGLVHISKMSHERIKHPLDVLSIGDIVEVKVIDVDLNKKRVALSLI